MRSCRPRAGCWWSSCRTLAMYASSRLVLGAYRSASAVGHFEGPRAGAQPALRAGRGARRAGGPHRLALRRGRRPRAAAPARCARHALHARAVRAALRDADGAREALARGLAWRALRRRRDRARDPRFLLAPLRRADRDAGLPRRGGPRAASSARIFAGAAVLNLALALLLTPKLGLEGPALATAIPFVLAFPLLLLSASRRRARRLARAGASAPGSPRTRLGACSPPCSSVARLVLEPSTLAAVVCLVRAASSLTGPFFTRSCSTRASAQSSSADVDRHGPRSGGRARATRLRLGRARCARAARARFGRPRSRPRGAPSRASACALIPRSRPRSRVARAPARSRPPRRQSAPAHAAWRSSRTPVRHQRRRHSQRSGPEQVPGPARPQQRAWSERNLAVDVSCEVHAEKRQRGVGHRVDESRARAARRSRTQIQVGAPERDDARVGRGARRHGQPVRGQARAEDGKARPCLALRMAEHDAPAPLSHVPHLAVRSPRALPAARSSAASERATSREVHDARSWANAAPRRRARAARPPAARRRQPPQPRHAVLAPAPLQLVEPPRARRSPARRSACRSARSGCRALRSTRRARAPPTRTAAPLASRARSRSPRV